MNKKLKWLLCLGLVGFVTGSAFVASRFQSHPTRLATPNPKPETPNSRVSPLRTTLSRFSTAAASPAPTRTASLSRFEQAQLLESREMLDPVTNERVVVEILKINAKHPFVRVETRFDAGAVASAPPRVIQCVADQVIVSAKTSTTQAALEKELRQIDAQILQTSIDSPVYLVSLPSHSPNAVPDALDALNRSPLLSYAEPHFVTRAHLTPNDPYVPNQYALNSIRMPEAWDIQTGKSYVVIGVLDTGVDLGHPDLQGRFWRNTGEIAGNGRDDDGNGYTDDWQGMNFAYLNTNPADDNGHGTFIAGILAGVPNNGQGMAGLNWDVRIMPVKIMNNQGLLYAYDEMLGLDYARHKGVQIVNLSFGGVTFIQSEFDALSRMQDAGILVTCSAGNDANDNDSGYRVNYPSSYSLANIIAVGASDQSDAISYYSNYGATTVDLFAPGDDILSALLGGGYTTESGTSFAAPHVAGVAGLLKAQYPSWNYVQLRSAILNYVDLLPGMTGKCVSGGRLNAYESLLQRVSLPEALDSGSLVWTSGGSRKWFGQPFVSHDGVDSATSGKIGDGQISSLQTTVIGPGRLTFWWKVSSEAGVGTNRFDYLQFKIDGLEQAWIEGENDWEFRSFDVTAGSHTFQWRYIKDMYLSAGQDRGWVDEVYYRADSGPPVLRITSPTGTNVTTSSLDISGTAADDFSVQKVEFRFENAVDSTAWQDVTQNPDWSNWTISIPTLQPGTNLLQLRATDEFARVSTVNRTYIRLMPLQVNTDGCGTVSSNLAGSTYQALGKTFAIKAKPCADYLFSHWDSSVNGPSYAQTLTFTMQENLQLTACFVTNYFTAQQGKFSGLFYETNEVLPQSSGFFKLSLTSTGNFTGSIICDGQTNAFSGKFDPGTLLSSLTVTRPSKAALNVSLLLDTNGAEQITGTVTADTWQALLLADRCPWSAATNPAPYAGQYTFIVPGDADWTNSPSGFGYGAVTINTGGKLTLAGKLADNKPFSQATFISGDGDWPLFASLYPSGKGALLGWMKFLVPPDLTNNLVSWMRPTIATSKLYPAGFSNEVAAIGSPYVLPAGSRVLNWTNGILVLTGGDLSAPSTNTVILSPLNVVRNGGPNPASVTINTANGTFSGTFRLAGTSQTYPFYGALLQNQDIGLGFFTGTNYIGEVRLQAAP